MSLIEMENVTKEFVQHKHYGGLSGTIKSFFKNESIVKRVVDDITISINQGELVGYIGPNGAGKSTTIKMLSGILVPTSGRIHVNGLIPFENRKINAKSIGVMFGHRSQLWWDLPHIETYNLLRHLYEIDLVKYNQTIKLFNELLGLDEFSRIPVRQLSLGQRMRAEIGAALVHHPPILYLDEPTIGMDIMVTERIRQFLKEINKQEETTIILTSHNLDEVERLCSRFIVINSGKILFDGSPDRLRSCCKANSILMVEFERNPIDYNFEDLDIYERKGNNISFLFNRNNTSASKLIEVIINKYPVKDISIKDPPIDAIIKELYQSSNSTLEGFI